MREIKFRGYDNFEHEWAYGCYVKYLDTDFIYFPEEDGVDSCEVLPETVGQYVGLKDINGVEIYEGDIVKFINYKTKDNAIIKFSYGYVGGWVIIAEADDENEKGLSLGLHNSEIEVIGNIYENPELLKEE